MATLREIVWERARGCCEYCQMPQSLSILPHELDHIVAQQHHGKTELENLCLACTACNARKGPNLSGIDQQTGQHVRLFDPRTQDWVSTFAGTVLF
jgi:5-methylcytosine-specific restriction endonuclease McrA